MNFSRTATVLAAVALITIGSAVVVNAAIETDPVELCSNSKTGAVSVPKNGTCGKGSVGFSVASSADVETLNQSISALESNAEGLKLTALGKLVGMPAYRWSGSGLKPGSDVTLHYVLSDGTTHASANLGQADANGNFSGAAVTGCRADAYLEGTRPPEETESLPEIATFSNMIPRHPLCVED